MMLNPCYLPPENSNWGSDSDNFFNHLSSVLFSADDVDLYVGGGDYNARIATKQDYIEGVDDVAARKVIDNGSNKHGDAFIDFLLSSKLCILNGRVDGHDDYTFINPQGRSVVDYFVTNIENVNRLAPVC